MFTTHNGKLPAFSWCASQYLQLTILKTLNRFFDLHKITSPILVRLRLLLIRKKERRHAEEEDFGRKNPSLSRYRVRVSVGNFSDFERQTCNAFVSHYAFLRRSWLIPGTVVLKTHIFRPRSIKKLRTDDTNSSTTCSCRWNLAGNEPSEIQRLADWQLNSLVARWMEILFRKF